MVSGRPATADAIPYRDWLYYRGLEIHHDEKNRVQIIRAGYYGYQ
jgi:hypothetical protein